MVMMTGEPLRDLVPGDRFGAVVGLDHTSFLEHRERAIDGRGGDPSRQILVQLGCRHWTPGTLEGCDDLTTPACESNAQLTQPLFDLALED
jgi:hypothetical protein